MRASTSSFKAKIPALTVCALALLVVSLNLARPIQTLYHYSANVVASENRFASLERAQKLIGKPYICLRPIEDLLNELPYQASVSNAVPNLKVRAVDVFSNVKLTSEELSKSLVSSSQLPDDLHQQEEKSKEVRWNRWRISILEHQIENSGHFSQADQSKTDTAEDTNGSPYKLVSTAKKLPESEVIATLKKELEERKKVDEKNSQADSDSRFAGNGIISLSTPWQIRLATGNSHTALLFFCFAFSVLAAFAVNGFQELAFFRITRGRHRDDFARTMQRLNVPVLGVVGNQAKVAVRPSEKVEIRIDKWQNFRSVFYKASEWVLLLSMAISCARLLFDPVWRDLIFHSPLAAISCLTYRA